jgi:haloacid dehalogenase superfamily, subfamily IA, variant 3 with third motif having DD or ED
MDKIEVALMNFIFDIGNVLIDFKPEQFLHTLFNNPLDETKINDIIFRSNEWIRLDQGTITPKEASENFCSEEPKYKGQIIKTMKKLPDMLTPIHRTIEMLPRIKTSGHKLYYLSNYHRELSRYVQDRYPFFSLFDGGVFSCDVHMLKPSAEIYQYILDKYQLNARECVFFDDTERNITAAEKIGIKGVLFTDVCQIEHFIADINSPL